MALNYYSFNTAPCALHGPSVHRMDVTAFQNTIQYPSVMGGIWNLNQMSQNVENMSCFQIHIMYRGRSTKLSH